MLPNSEAQAAVVSSKILLDVKYLVNKAFGWSMFRTKLAEHGHHGLNV